MRRIAASLAATLLAVTLAGCAQNGVDSDADDPDDGIERVDRRDEPNNDDAGDKDPRDDDSGDTDDDTPDRDDEVGFGWEQDLSDPDGPGR